MDTLAGIPLAERVTAPRVYTCYEILGIAPTGGVVDFTDGKYIDEQNHRTAYLAAQHRQAEYLLDQAGCCAGSRLLDIGCGHGRILVHAALRGADACGITISPQQAAYCKTRGLHAYELDYRDIFKRKDLAWGGAFDALVANGSLEHFVQVADAAAGRSDAIYTEMFELFRRLLRHGGRLVTTTIHFRRTGQVAARDLIDGPYARPYRSATYHFAMVLERTFGGWYPEPGQLQRCASSHFKLIAEEDGTHDYHLTSEYWLSRLRWAAVFDPRVWYAIGRKWRSHPRAVAEMLRCQLWDQSWAWQFRPPSPTRLLRQVWRTK